jgi:TPR repeat protein
MGNKSSIHKSSIIKQKYDIPEWAIFSEKDLINMFKYDKIDNTRKDSKYYCLRGVYYERKLKNNYLAKKCYLMAVENNDIYALCMLGYYYYTIEKDLINMEKYYLLSAEYGFNDALVGLADNYYNEKKYTEYKKYIMMAIEKGNKIAMDHYGIYYHTVEKNYDEMKKYYSMAIERDHILSLVNLGWYYYDIEKNYDLMKKYYLIAINRGNSYAMFYLGKYYYDIEGNFNKMEKYLIMASKKGNSEAMIELATCYFVKNEHQHNRYTEKYLLMAVEEGNSDAMYLLGNYYIRKVYRPACSSDIPYYYGLAEKYLLMALESNNSEALITLAELHCHEGDIKKMMSYYVKAINEYENVNAMRKLGEYYMSDKQYELSKKYLQMAIDKGDEEAILQLKKLDDILNNEITKNN